MTFDPAWVTALVSIATVIGLAFVAWTLLKRAMADIESHERSIEALELGAAELGPILERAVRDVADGDKRQETLDARVSELERFRVSAAERAVALARRVDELERRRRRGSGNEED